MSMQEGPAGNRLYYGTAAIAERLELTERQVRHLCSQKRIPFWKLGSKMICTSERMIQQWFQDQETAALAKVSGDQDDDD